MDKKQLSIFEDKKWKKEWWEDDWEGMPEFIQEDLSPFRTILVHFRNEKDLRAFEKLVGQKIRKYAGGPGTIWHPKAEIKKFMNKRYIDADES